MIGNEGMGEIKGKRGKRMNDKKKEEGKEENQEVC